MFTSRAEYRLLLRQDNADSRLMRKGFSLGLIPASAIARLEEKEGRVAAGTEALRTIRISGSDLLGAGSDSQEPQTAHHLLKRPDVKLKMILGMPPAEVNEDLRALHDDHEAELRVETEVKYEGYLRRQEEDIRQFRKSEEMKIPEPFDYHSLRALSIEGKEKLSRVRPKSIGQASRISGVTPSDVSVLMIALMR